MAEDAYTSNANSFPDGQRGRIVSPDAARAGALGASALPSNGPGMLGRRFPSGTTITPLPSKRGGSSGSSSAPTPPWKPLAAPYIGSGTAPSDWGLHIMIQPGFVWDGVEIWQPASKSLVISVPPNVTDGFFVYLDATVSAAGIISALDYGYGRTLPSAVTLTSDAVGTPPPHAYDLLFEVTSTQKAVELSAAKIYRATPLILMPQITNQGNGTERRMAYNPTSADLESLLDS